MREGISPSGINCPSVSPIRSIIDGGHKQEYIQFFLAYLFVLLFCIGNSVYRYRRLLGRVADHLALQWCKRMSSKLNEMHKSLMKYINRFNRKAHSFCCNTTQIRLLHRTASSNCEACDNLILPSVAGGVTCYVISRCLGAASAPLASPHM